LWSISEKSYGTGFNWTDIAEANNLSESDALEAGQELQIPEVTPLAMASGSPEATPLTSPVATASPVAMEASPLPSVTPGAIAPTPAPTITGSSYTVVAGDTLWDIACRAYGDCYAWVKIAEANKLINPNLIHPGNVFTLPR
jgi:nucleoid-associated protein YgaU